jgi:hypothetical protein
MANDRKQSPFTINATANYQLTDVGDGAVGLLVVHIVDGGAYSGTITVKGRAKGNTSGTYVAIPYIKLHLNGAVGDGSQVSTAITTTSLICLDATGLDVSLDVTFTSGSATVYVATGVTR